MSKMNFWSNVYKIWCEFCPIFKRPLISKEGFVIWAKELGYVKTFEEDGFLTFIGFLEEFSRLNPIAFSKTKKSFVYQPSETCEFNDDKDLTSFYHPIQFFDTIRQFEIQPYRRQPYHFNRDFERYFWKRKLQLEIKKISRNIEFSKGKSWDVEHLIEILQKKKNEIQNYNDIPDTFPNPKEELMDWKVGGTRNLFFSEQELITWIKIESFIHPNKGFIFGPRNIALKRRFLVNDPWNEKEFKLKEEKYNNWKVNKLDEINDTFSEEDKKTIEKLTIIPFR